jgi:hypothetical protein
MHSSIIFVNILVLVIFIQKTLFGGAFFTIFSEDLRAIYYKLNLILLRTFVRTYLRKFCEYTPVQKPSYEPVFLGDTSLQM